MIKLHDRNFKPLVWAWKILRIGIKPIRGNVSTSLVDVFASFIYLSSCRLLLTSMSFLLPNKIYTSFNNTSDGNMQLTAKSCLYYAPDVEYFGREHLPFALLSIVLLTLFYAIPMTPLFLYPFSCFQHMLNKIGFNSPTLYTFMEVFQGAYKDGTWYQRLSLHIWISSSAASFD